MDNVELPLVKKEILTSLLSHEGLRYSEAMPHDVPNDLYNYHLQHLIKQGYVQKQSDRHFLTVKGKRFVETVRPISPSGEMGDLFRTNVLVVLLKSVDGCTYVLNQTRKCHPYYGDKGIIGGPIRHGELVEDACTRVLKEEAGLTASFTVVGIIRKIRSTPDGKLFSDIFYHVGLSSEHEDELQVTTVYGENYWASFELALTNEASSVQGGASIVKVLKQIGTQGKAPFFYYQERMTVQV